MVVPAERAAASRYEAAGPTALAASMAVQRAVPAVEATAADDQAICLGRGADSADSFYIELT